MIVTLTDGEIDIKHGKCFELKEKNKSNFYVSILIFFRFINFKDFIFYRPPDKKKKLEKMQIN